MTSIGQKYLEAEILGAEPLALVSLLYRAAIEALGQARRHLRNGAIRDRSRQITKASEIINELMFSLDHQNGGSLSRDLAGLYGYMQARLVDANFHQADAPLAEVQQLLQTLLEGWGAIQPQPQAF